MFFTLIFIALSLVALTQVTGGVEINALGYEIQMPFAVFVAGSLVVLVFIAWLFSLKSCWRLFCLKRAFRKYRQQEEKAQAILLEGMSAVIAKEPEHAQKCLQKMKNWREGSPLTLLLAAQTAVLTKDDYLIEKRFQQLLDHPQTHFMGVRGLVLRYLNQRNYKAASEVVNSEIKQQGEAKWALETAFDLAVRQRDWSEALTLLKRLERKKMWPAEKLALHQALTLYEQAQEQKLSNPEESTTLLHKSYKLAPTLFPIALALVKGLFAQGSYRKGFKIIEESWKLQPHRELLKLYSSQEKDALERFKRAQHLYSFAPGKAESELGLGESAIEAELWGVAATHLEAALGIAPTQSAYQAMILLQERLNREEEKKQWLEKSTKAWLDPEWECGDCHFRSPTWFTLCPHCHSFGQAQWLPETSVTLQTPSQQEVIPPLS